MVDCTMLRSLVFMAVVVCASAKLPLHELAIDADAPKGSALEAVIQVHSSSLEDQNVDGQTPLHVAAAKGTSRILSAFLKAGANVEALDNHGKAPVHWTIHSVTDKDDAIRKIKALQKHGANINSRRGDGLSPVHAAVHMNSPDAVEVLADAGANLEELAENGTPLHYAALLGSQAAITALGKAKANLEASESHGYRAMHCAVMVDNVESIRTLVKAGAVLESHNKQGLTPLQFATVVGKLDSIRALVELGAEPALKHGGINAFELAGRNVTILRALQKASYWDVVVDEYVPPYNDPDVETQHVQRGVVT